MRLYLVTDPDQMPLERLLAQVEALVAAGVTMVQLRDKRADTRTLVAQARALIGRLRPLGVPLVVNDRVDVALAAGADGVHVGDVDLDPIEARRLLGPRAIVGVSVERADASARALLTRVEAIADYVAASGVYPSTTKLDLGTPLEPQGLAAIRAWTRLPLVAIGGIGPGRVAPLVDAGADGVAVVSAILRAERPAEAALALRVELEGAFATRPNQIPVAIALSIAGSDSGGGAGVQADLKAMSALGVYGATVITAITAQNTRGVSAVHLAPPEVVRAQIDAVASDLRVGAIKIGMLGSASIACAVAEGLQAHAGPPVVVDPVMVAKSGDRLLDDDAVHTLRTRVLPLATVLTPNLPEAAALLGRAEPRTPAEMIEAGRALRALGPAWVLIKGGHLPQTDDRECADVLVGAGAPLWLRAPRVDTPHTHGTGCTLSAAIAAELALGAEVPEAVSAAKRYLSLAIAGAARLGVGAGRGPVAHFHALWPSALSPQR